MIRAAAQSTRRKANLRRPVKWSRNEEPLAFVLEVAHMVHGSRDPVGRSVGTDSGT